MFIANRYVRVKGTLYKKGERIPDDLPEEKIAWLLESEAIHETAVISAPTTAEMIPELPADEADVSEPETVEGPPPEEEADEEAEAPEIDVMAGIVQGEPENLEDPEEAEKASPKTGRKKQTERRKSK